jgi:ribokinase
MSMSSKPLIVMGIFVADVTFRTPSMPVWGETLLGTSFKLGPGGKGSNQSVAVARLGGKAFFITKIGKDPFGQMARDMYLQEGIDSRFVFSSDQHSTGAAAIIVDDKHGENAIIVTPGAANALTVGEVNAARDQFSGAAAFLTQLELPVEVVEHGLNLAHGLGVPTILNPAPACSLSDSMLQLCDYLTPNETEAEGLTGHKIITIEDAEKAADILLKRGVGTVVLTLGARGALIKNANLVRHVPAFDAGPVVDTTGAGDAFNGGFAVALAENLDIIDAVRMGCAVAGISVTRPGTAPSMPSRNELDQLFPGKESANSASLEQAVIRDKG